MKALPVAHTISINTAGVIRDGQYLFDLSRIGTDDIPAYLYKSLDLSYPKFYKMDRISKLGFLAAELLMQVVDSSINKDKVALLLTTADGCREIDEKFEASRSEIPSPALFVYTLPNIVAGEICIRNGFKGEQMVWVATEEDKRMSDIYMSTLFSKGDTDACIVGFINAYQDDLRCELRWVEEGNKLIQ